VEKAAVILVEDRKVQEEVLSSKTLMCVADIARDSLK
jgi:hypothetical protein